jgi:hypothetical protein
MIVSNTKPEYLYAAPAPHSPTGATSKVRRDGPVAGVKRWEITIHVTTRMRHHRDWNIGYRIAGITHIIHLQITP